MSLNFKNFIGFALIKNDNSREAQKLSLYCLLNDIKILRLNKNIPCPIEYVPCGSVEWCLQSLGQNIIPDYYPNWLQRHLYRKVWKEYKWPLNKKVFIKPADRYKRFTGFITTGTYKKKKKPPFWCSDIVSFKNEWRYYISNGKILCGEWYWGDEINEPSAPDLYIDIPQNYCGALDFGELFTGQHALIEAQHPFACGWYGKNDTLYFQWLIDGWGYMLKNKL